jgi:3-isopropylmalate dehydrogenase
VLLKIAVLPGDGIGVEVTREALKVLERAAELFGHELKTFEGLVGGAAIQASGDPLPAETLETARRCGAVLFGAVGAPQFDHLPPNQRPEKGLLRLRKELDLFANLRPARIYPGLEEFSPLKNEIVKGVDVLVVRELSSGIYYGTPRGVEKDRGFNTMSYTREEVRRVARSAFEMARGRRKKVTSVDKFNVLETSQFWHAVVDETAKEFPDVKLEHALVDSCAMRLVTHPRDFDVVLTENMFGDILSDEAAVLAGSIGMLASASLGTGPGLYEPVHGSAPDIAGKDKANPLGAIGSAAMMLRHSFGLGREAAAVEAAMEQALASGLRTADLRGKAGTREMGQAVCAALRK